VSLKLSIYGVRLDFFYKALGSQDEKLLDRCLDWIEQRLSPIYAASYNPGSVKEEYFNELYRIIFEGVVDAEVYSVGDEFGIYHKGWDSSGLIEAIHAVFAQDEAFEEYGSIGHYNYTDAFERLTESTKVDSYIETLWKYLLGGRPLANGVRAKYEYDYYGYLTNAEVSIFLESVRIQPFEYLGIIQGLLEPVAKQGLDLFFYGG
jgi:hypothetical protein